MNSFSQEKIPNGINITGLEKTWHKHYKINKTKTLHQLKSAHKLGFSKFRIALDLDYFLMNNYSGEERKLNKILNKLVRYAKKNELTIVFSYFNHQLNDQNFSKKKFEISDNWLHLLKNIDHKNTDIYIDIANEPLLNSNHWREAAIYIIHRLRHEYPDLKIVYGETNYNSIFELERSEPLPIDNIIYQFHFYEPFIFTHQGTEWTGDQNSTTEIPFPFKDSKLLPSLNPKAIGTDGEINYRDYYLTGNNIAIEHKLQTIKNWSIKNGVIIWCTEFGVSENADNQSRKNYIQAVSETLDRLKIEGFIWEYSGNFGIENIYEP